MRRTWKIAIVMALLLLSINAGQTDATTRCGKEIGQTYTGMVLVQLRGCFTWTKASNLNAFSLECRAHSIGLGVSNIRSTEDRFVSGGRTYVRTGCTWMKEISLVGIIFARTSCYLYADSYVSANQLHIGPTHWNWC
jgi:hypothetical protein